MSLKRELFDETGKSRGHYSEQNVVNDLTGREWVFWSRSVITKAYPPKCQHELRSAHGGQKPPDLCADLIRVFTKHGERVLDPMMGVGGVLLGASIAGRQGLGVDINPKWVQIYRDVCRAEGLATLDCRVGDSEALLPSLEPESFDLVLTDVPYWNMDRARRSPGRYKRVGEPSRPVRATKLARFDDAFVGTKDEWLAKMTRILGLAAGLLRRRRYLVVFIGDMYADERYHCLSADLARCLEGVPSLAWKASLIWYDVSKKLHLYGYQYAYIPSMVHQNILVFRKD